MASKGSKASEGQSVIDYGIVDYLHGSHHDEKQVGRIVGDFGKNVEVATLNNGLIKMSIKKNIIYNSDCGAPVVGDFVLYSKMNQIVRVMPRSSEISRAESRARKDFHARHKEQIIAANVQTLFIVIAANQRFTVGKLIRYVNTFSNEGVELAVVITKCDFEEQAAKVRDTVRNVFPEITVHEVSIFDVESIYQMSKSIGEKTTIALIGASGAGKSSLINVISGTTDILIGDVQKGSQRGRHTTSSSRIYYLNNVDAYLLDTPGFKTIDSTKTKDNQDTAIYSDIKELAHNCKFRNCHHLSEPDCAVKTAVKVGKISAERLVAYQKDNGWLS